MGVVGPWNPPLHTQSLAESLPTGDIESRGHESQAESPKLDLYVPAVHCEHGPPFGPVKPGSHLQALRLVLSSGEDEWGGQETHVDPVAWQMYPYRLEHESSFNFKEEEYMSAQSSPPQQLFGSPEFHIFSETAEPSIHVQTPSASVSLPPTQYEDGVTVKAHRSQAWTERERERERGRKGLHA
jgi:hypothetical protein